MHSSRQAQPVEVPLRRLFEMPTVAGLAAGIDAACQNGQELQAPPLLPASQTGRTREAAEQLLATLDQLSEADVDALLSDLVAQEESLQ